MPIDSSDAKAWDIASRAWDSATITYVKSNNFRVVFAEGAYGGISPRGRISFAFYNERQALPRSSELRILPDGSASETTTEQVSDIVRELEVEMVMDLAEAEEFSKWLAEKVALLRAVQDGKANAS